MRIIDFIKKTKTLPDSAEVRFSCMTKEATTYDESNVCGLYKESYGIEVQIFWDSKKALPIKYIRDIVLNNPDIMYKEFFHQEEDSCCSHPLKGVVIDKGAAILHG